MSYVIEKNLIPGLPKKPYVGGVGAWNAIVNHSTATPNATADAERNFESTHYNDAFVHYFVDDKKILQVADINYLAYGCGNGNSHGLVQIELCEFADPTRFKNAYDRYIWLTAYLLHSKKLGVKDKETVFSHKDAALKWGGSTHTDPIEFLASHAISWSKHIANIEATYNAMNAPTYVYYTVVSGDYLGKIANKYNTTVDNLCKLNHINSTDVLNIGQKLRVK